jgi:hypothetical protein
MVNGIYKVKSSKIDKCVMEYKNPDVYEKCYTCNRIISGIVNGPDIIKFISDATKKNYSEDSLLLLLRRFSVWYYHDIYDNFNINLKKQFNFSHSHIRNICSAINEMYGLPAANIINERTNDLLS